MLSLVLLKHLGKKGEKGTISMGKSLFSSLEALQLGGDSQEHVGLKEFTFSDLESVTDDLSDVFDHVLDESVFSLDGFPSSGFGISSGLHLIGHGGSFLEFGNFVSSFISSGCESGGVKGGQASEFGEVGIGLVDTGLVIGKIGCALV
jgi:hypothetical protein